MIMKTKPSLENILFEHGLDHIMNSSDEEFSQFASDFNLDTEKFKLLNSKAARKALETIDASATNSSSRAKGPFQLPEQKVPLNHEEKLTLLKRLMACVERLGLSCRFQLKDLDMYDDLTLDYQISQFQSMLDSHDSDN